MIVGDIAITVPRNKKDDWGGGHVPIPSPFYHRITVHGILNSVYIINGQLSFSHPYVGIQTVWQY